MLQDGVDLIFTVVNSQTLQQLRFHSVSGFSDAKKRVPSFAWNALERKLERFGTQIGTRSERVWNAFRTRSGRVPNANGTRTQC